MYSFTSSSIEAAELLQKLSLDSQTKTIEIPDATKKASVNSSNVNGIQSDRSVTPILPDFMDPTICYVPNGYPSAYYYSGGFDGRGNDWDEYTRYVNSDGVELTPVPCGTENEQKPPKCRKLCRVATLCGHGSICKPHRCHYGACPPCRLVCNEEYSCGHKCKLRCHGPIPPPLPEFTLKPQKKKSNHLSDATPGSSCPPCPELVLRSCVGYHFGAERMMVCSNRAEFSCDNLCGNPLPCGNHYCTYVCHAFKSHSSKSGESCEECNLPCEKKRYPACTHPCPLPCHPGQCPPCKALIKRSCHCGSMKHVFECKYFNSLSEEERMAVRSCKGPCHRKLPNCTHLCPEMCHPGSCPFPDKCSKKVTVRCGCQTLKKEWLCHDVQAAYCDSGCDPKDVPKNQYGIGLLPCDNDCKSKMKVPDAQLHFRQAKPQEVKESDKANNASKRRRRRQRIHVEESTSRLQKIFDATKRVLLVLIVGVIMIVSAYFGYGGLVWLSDWMNELETRQRRRLSRI